MSFQSRVSPHLFSQILVVPDVPHYFRRREKQIIEYPYSCYVLGRSGTG
jgi:hypothetical protein